MRKRTTKSIELPDDDDLCPEEETMSIYESFAQTVAPGLRHELIGGLIYPWSRDSNDHEAVQKRTELIIKKHLECSLETMFPKSSGRPLIHANSVLYPDIWVSALVPDPVSTRTVAAPALVIEVVAPAREKLERGAKLRAYRAIPTLKEILLVDVKFSGAELYRRIGDRSWAFHELTPHDELSLQTIDLTVPLSRILGKGTQCPDSLHTHAARPPRGRKHAVRQGARV